MPQARTRASTCPGPGTGRSISSTVSCFPRNTIARMKYSYRLSPGQAEAAGGDDVLVDLAGAGGDRQGDAALVVLGGATVQRGAVVAGDELAGEAERVDGEVGGPLLQLRAGELR